MNSSTNRMSNENVIILSLTYPDYENFRNKYKFSPLVEGEISERILEVKLS